jgi:hypothetical protein
METGRKVKVASTGANPEKGGGFIIAGVASNGRRGDSKPVAVQLDEKTKVLNREGESLPLAFAAALKAGGEVVVEGRSSKRGVIRAKRIIVV